MSSSPPDVSLQKANDGKLAAAQLRFEYISGLYEGFITVADLLTAAATPEGQYLRGLTLRRVLLAASQEQWSKTKCDKKLEHMLDVLGVKDVCPGRVTVGWLLDPRAGGRRQIVWADTLTPRRGQEPWVGFPYAPPPTPQAARA